MVYCRELCCEFYLSERDNRPEVSDGEDVVGERLQQDVVSLHDDDGQLLWAVLIDYV